MHHAIVRRKVEHSSRRDPVRESNALFISAKQLMNAPLSNSDRRAEGSGTDSDMAKARPIISSLQRAMASLPSLFDNSYVCAILCLAALFWTVSTFGYLRVRFDKAGTQCGRNDFACYFI